jgi:5-formyltetrahydrofolate cyclo-ligase
VRDQKQRLREEVLLKRKALSPAELAGWHRAIEARVLALPAYNRSRSVALYSPIGNEVETEDICDHALKLGKAVFYPKTSGETTGWVQVDSRRRLQTHNGGIPEPAAGPLLEEGDYEGLVVFVPGLAFDSAGHRLGRGRGWYDRALALLGTGPERVALAFEFQIVESLPVEDWDQGVHQIVTEKRIIRCFHAVPR